MAVQRTLWYFADPMCSWCWGFAPVISAIEDVYKEWLKIELVLGGLRPGTTEPVTPEFRKQILHHWQEVQKRTGQPFVFDGALPDGFVYDTEPASRAVVAVGEMNPAAALPYFKSVQRAFYAEQKDVTKPEILAGLAGRQNLETAKFLNLFSSELIKNGTRVQFQQSRETGVTGFPTVVLQDDKGAKLLTVGYQPFDAVRRNIDEWIVAGHSG